MWLGLVSNKYSFLLPDPLRWDYTGVCHDTRLKDPFLDVYFIVRLVL